MVKVSTIWGLLNGLRGQRNSGLHWILTFLGIGAFAGWVGYRYEATLNQLHLEWLLVIGLALCFWFQMRRLYVVALGLLVGTGWLLHYFLFILPSWQESLQPLENSSIPVWVQGKVMRFSQEGKEIKLRLNSVTLYLSDSHQKFPEIDIHFSARRSTPLRFYYRRSLQFNGTLATVRVNQNRLSLHLREVSYHDTLNPMSDWIYQGKILHQNLIQRAAFYLSEESQALFLPVILARNVYRAEPTKLFRKTGMAHLLAISGLHIGLLFWLGLSLVRQIGRFSESWLLWVHFPRLCQGITLFGIWSYLFLIAFPVPATRAALMLTFLLLARWSGRAHSPVQVLLVTAYGLICFNPTVIYDLSFQLSFVAVLYILMALPFFQTTSAWTPWWHRLGIYCFNNILVTGIVLIGIWPILATYFREFSLEPIWLNLFMLPLLAFLVLPVGLIVLGVSFVSRSSPPFGWLETQAFQGMEWVLQLWLEVLTQLHEWGNVGRVSVPLDWEGWHYLLYYGVTTFFCGAIGMVWRRYQVLKQRQSIYA